MIPRALNSSSELEAHALSLIFVGHQTSWKLRRCDSARSAVRGGSLRDRRDQIVRASAHRVVRLRNNHRKTSVHLAPVLHTREL